MKDIKSEPMKQEFYQVPTLKKYGSMKSIVQGGPGSVGDEISIGGRDPKNPTDLPVVFNEDRGPLAGGDLLPNNTDDPTQGVNDGSAGGRKHFDIAFNED